MKSFRLTSFGASVAASMAAMALLRTFRLSLGLRPLLLLEFADEFLRRLRQDFPWRSCRSGMRNSMRFWYIQSPAPLDGGNAEVHALADVAAREDVQSCLPDVVSPHFVGGREGFDGADDVGQERGEFAVAEFSERRNDGGADDAVVVLQERLHDLVELLAVHAIERVGEDAARLAVSGIGGKQGAGSGALVHAARVRGRRAEGHGEEVADAFLVTEAGEGFGGETLEPGVRILEGGAQLRQGGCGTLAEPSECLHSTIAGVAILAIEHRDQRGGEVAAAFADGLRRMIAHGGRPALRVLR